MALEDLTGPSKFISSLVVTNPTPDDFRDEGDDHMRGIKNVLRNTFPGATRDLFGDLLGMIAPFPIASAGTSPPNWLLCDGRTITEANYPRLFRQLGIVGAGNLVVPDLRGRFVRGRDMGILNDPAGDRNWLTEQSDAVSGHTHSLADPGHQHYTVNDAAHPVTDGGSSDLGLPGSGGTLSRVYHPSNTTDVRPTGASVGDLNAFIAAAVGTNKVTNGDFAVNANWTFQGGASISGGGLNLPATAGYAWQQIVPSLTVGKRYRASVGIVAGTPTLQMFLGTGATSGDIARIDISGAGGTFDFVTPIVNPYIGFYNSAGPGTAILDNASLLELDTRTIKTSETRPRNIALTYCMYVGPVGLP